MKQVQRGVMLCLAGMLAVSCSVPTSTSLNPRGFNRSFSVEVKSSDKLDLSRLKISSDKAVLAKYVTNVPLSDEAKAGIVDFKNILSGAKLKAPISKDSGFSTKAYALTNKDFSPVVAINDPTDLDAHATHVEVLGVHHDPGTETQAVMSEIIRIEEIVKLYGADVTKKNQTVEQLRKQLNFITLIGEDPKAALELQSQLAIAETNAWFSGLLYNYIRYYPDYQDGGIFPETPPASYSEFESMVSDPGVAKVNSLAYTKTLLKAAIATDRGTQSPYMNGTLYTAATFNAHYVEDGHIYDTTENGYKQGYTLLIDNSDEVNPKVVAKIGLSGAEFTMAYATNDISYGSSGSSGTGSYLFITGSDPAAKKNGNIQKQAFVMKYDVTDPENPKYMGIRYFEGRNAVSIHGITGSGGVMVLGTGQSGGIFIIGPDLSDVIPGTSNIADSSYKDIRDAILTNNGEYLLAIDGGFTDQPWDTSPEITQNVPNPFASPSASSSPTTGVATNEAKLITIDTSLTNNSTSLNFSSNGDVLGGLGSNLAKASVAQVGTNERYALGLSEGGIKIVDGSGVVVTSAPIPGRTVNHVYVSPEADKDGNFMIVASAGYNGIEFYSYNPATDSLQNTGSKEMYKRVNGGNIRAYGASTNGFNYYNYTYDISSGTSGTGGTGGTSQTTIATNPSGGLWDPPAPYGWPGYGTPSIGTYDSSPGILRSSSGDVTSVSWQCSGTCTDPIISYSAIIFDSSGNTLDTFTTTETSEDISDGSFFTYPLIHGTEYRFAFGLTLNGQSTINGATDITWSPVQDATNYTLNITSQNSGPSFTYDAGTATSVSVDDLNSTLGNTFGGVGSGWNLSVTATIVKQGGGGTSGTTTKTYSVPLGMVANGVNGATFGNVIDKSVTDGSGEGRY